MKIEDIRILWNVDEDGNINDILIEEFKKGFIDMWPSHLHKIYRFDYGNSLHNWDEYNFYDILLKFLFMHEFKNKAIKYRFERELLKIDGFKEIFVTSIQKEGLRI